MCNCTCDDGLLLYKVIFSFGGPLPISYHVRASRAFTAITKAHLAYTKRYEYHSKADITILDIHCSLVLDDVIEVAKE